MVHDAEIEMKQFGAVYKGVLARVCVCIWGYRAFSPIIILVVRVFLPTPQQCTPLYLRKRLFHPF